MRRVYIRLYQQQGAHLNDPDHTIEFVLREKNKFDQTGNGYLQYDITARKDALLAVPGNRPNPPDSNFVEGDEIRPVYSASTYTVKRAGIATTGGSDRDHNKVFGTNSTILRAYYKRRRGYIILL